MIAKITGGLDGIDQAGVLQALLDRRRGRNPALKNIGGSAAVAGEFVLVKNNANAGFRGGKGNEPKPLVFQADNISS